METKKLEPHIVEAFKTFGFAESDITAGCWCLERNGKKVAWIALHKFLERVAQKANIVFDEPKVMNCTEKEVAVYVNGHVAEVSAWSIGEASVTNCKNDYRWAMAEKRAKDRVILKLLGVAGDMYSEEEADEFKNQPTVSEMEKVEGVAEFKKQAASDQRAHTAALKKGEDLNPFEKMSTPELMGRFTGCLNFVKSEQFISASKGQIDTTNRFIKELHARGMDDKAKEIEDCIKLDDVIKF